MSLHTGSRHWLGKWERGDFFELAKAGNMPEQGGVKCAMSEAIAEGLKPQRRLTAIADYLFAPRQSFTMSVRKDSN